MKYIVLLRGINAGAHRRVNMKVLKEQLADIGCDDVATYLATGNIVCASPRTRDELHKAIVAMLQSHYNFTIDFSLITADDYLRQADQLPAWWHEPVARKDVAFFTDTTDIQEVHQSAADMVCADGELVHVGALGIFFASRDTAPYKEVAYARWLNRQPYYNTITVRTGNTFNAILRMAQP
ncbi:MAG: DUF1697 domain-containing protein [Candidatus Saccharibacteria bacterium]|nr:DUF1697 domain-containing protein [Candidatus Saccharibacteria bacterium]